MRSCVLQVTGLVGRAKVVGVKCTKSGWIQDILETGCGKWVNERKWITSRVLALATH